MGSRRSFEGASKEIRGFSLSASGSRPSRRREARSTPAHHVGRPRFGFVHPGGSPGGHDCARKRLSMLPLQELRGST